MSEEKRHENKKVKKIKFKDDYTPVKKTKYIENNSNNNIGGNFHKTMTKKEMKDILRFSRVNKDFRKTFFKKISNKNNSKRDLFSLNTVDIDIQNYLRKKSSKKINTIKFNTNNNSINNDIRKSSLKKKSNLKKNHQRLFSLQMEESKKKREKLDKEKMGDYNKEFLSLIFNDFSQPVNTQPKKKYDEDDLLVEEEKNKIKKVKEFKAKILKLDEYTAPPKFQRENIITGRKMSKMLDYSSYVNSINKININMDKSDLKNIDSESENSFIGNKTINNKKYGHNSMFDLIVNRNKKKEQNSRHSSTSPKKNKSYDNYNEKSKKRVIKKSESDNKKYKTDEIKQSRKKIHKKVLSCDVNPDYSFVRPKSNYSLTDRDKKNNNLNKKVKKMHENIVQEFKLYDKNNINAAFCDNLELIKMKIKNKLIETTNELQKEIRYYKGPINPFWISLDTTVMKSIKNFRKKMEINGFIEYDNERKLKNNRFIFIKKRKMFNVELVKIQGNIFYYLFKN